MIVKKITVIFIFD